VSIFFRHAFFPLRLAFGGAMVVLCDLQPSSRSCQAPTLLLLQLSLPAAQPPQTLWHVRTRWWVGNWVAAADLRRVA